jgi:hypothetical protein
MNGSDFDRLMKANLAPRIDQPHCGDCDGYNHRTTHAPEEPQPASPLFQTGTHLREFASRVSGADLAWATLPGEIFHNRHYGYGSIRLHLGDRLISEYRSTKKTNRARLTAQAVEPRLMLFSHPH